MTDKAKAPTITLTVHRDKCDPSTWTIVEWKLLCDFIRDGSLQRAASLARLGVQLVLDDRHVPTGGTLEQIGWADPDDLSTICDTAQEAADVTGHVGPVDVVPIYRGPTQYAVGYGVGTDDDYEGMEVDVFQTLEEAEAFDRSLRERAKALME